MSWFRLPIAIIMSFAIVLTTVVPQNVVAHTLSQHEMKSDVAYEQLKEIFDRFHYAIAVEWDQKDAAFKAQAEKDLITSLEDSGFTTREIENYLARRLMNAQAASEFLRLLAALKKQDYTPKEAAIVTSEFMKKNYAEGLSFNGEGKPHGSKWGVIIAVAVVVLVTHWLIKKHHSKHDDSDDDDGDTVIIIVN